MRMAMDEGDDIGFHLRRHIHLTNCIHLKNHIHRQQSRVLADKSLMRDLSLLQKLRSLRDPSTSSSPWNQVSLAATATGYSFTRADNGKAFHHGRRRRKNSTVGGLEKSKHGRRLSFSSLPVSVGVSSKISPGQLAIGEDESTDGGDLTVRKKLFQCPTEAVVASVNSEPSCDSDENHKDFWSLKNLSVQLNNVQLDDDGSDFIAGLISSEKMVDLLDFAMSADTVNTVKLLRVIMNTGVEPLSLMSQLAAIITDILGGNFNFINQKSERNFFRLPKLSKDDMEKLRQALKTLSEAEKQMRMSSDKSTWLAAALLQLAPDEQYSSTKSTKKQYALPGSSSSPGLNQNRNTATSAPCHDADHAGDYSLLPIHGRYDTFQMNNYNDTNIRPCKKKMGSVTEHEILEIWFKVLETIQDRELKDFLCRNGRLASIRLGTDTCSSLPHTIVELVFSSHQYKSKAEKLRCPIMKAFESVIESPVVVKIRHHSPICLKAMDDPSIFEFSHRIDGDEIRLPEPGKPGLCEIVEVASSSSSSRRGRGGGSLDDLNNGGSNYSMGNVPLADMIRQTDGCLRRRGGWSRGRAVSIAEKLHQHIVTLEQRSKTFPFWKRFRNSRYKLGKLKWRKRSCSMLRSVFCGRFLRSRPRR